jgi:aminotransferase
MVISDEIYAELTYGFDHTSIASLPGMRERTVIVSGFSKAFAMTGWRLGYCCAPESVFRYIAQIHQYIIMSAPTPAQYAAIEGLLNGQNDVEHMRDEYNKRRKFLHTELCRMGFDCFEPEGAFYIFPNVTRFAKDGEDFVERLLDQEHVAVIPGNAFGESGKDHIRISYAYSIEQITKALERIERFITRNK